MKKLIIIFIVLILNTLNVYSQSKSSITPYQNNYFTVGNAKDQFKIQVSLQYLFCFHLYGAYTESMWWDWYKRSSPFSEFNHNPEIFYKIESNNNIFNNISLGILDYIQIGAEHKSNGLDKKVSRGWNRYYGLIQFSYGSIYNIGFNFKYWKAFYLTYLNTDYFHYKGVYEANIFFINYTKENIENEKINFNFGTYGTKGFIKISMFSRIFFEQFQPRLFIEYYYGYAESMIYYTKCGHSIRGGFLFQ